MASVRLPDLPKGKEFEEYVSSMFQSCGYYIERQIIERDIEEVLELDIVFTDYDQYPPEIKLIEVKSGDWGFPDLFKLRGWMDYLNFSESVFIANKEKENIDFLRAKCANLGIHLVVIPNLDTAREALDKYVRPQGLNDMDIAMWRFSYWVERNLMKRLNHSKKSQQSVKRYKSLEDYYFKVSSGIFFTENIIERLTQLYSTFQEYPRISAKCGNEMMGNDFDDEHELVPKQVYDEAYYKCQYNDIHISTFIEHRARIAILKNAVDYKLYRGAGYEGKAGDVRRKILGFEFSLFDSLPSSFRHGLDIICREQYCRRYSVVWQWFMWIFGGFILKDRQEEEYQMLSQKTGVPVEEIPNALKSYEILFPRPDGWFMDLSSVSDSRVIMLKMFPVPFMGIGANYRRLVYTESKEFDELKTAGRHTLDDLMKWNNLVVDVLQE